MIKGTRNSTTQHHKNGVWRQQWYHKRKIHACCEVAWPAASLYLSQVFSSATIFCSAPHNCHVGKACGSSSSNTEQHSQPPHTFADGKAVAIVASYWAEYLRSSALVNKEQQISCSNSKAYCPRGMLASPQVAVDCGSWFTPGSIHHIFC